MELRESLFLFFLLFRDVPRFTAVPVEESVVIFVRGVCKYDRNGLATTKHKTVLSFDTTTSRRFNFSVSGSNIIGRYGPN